MPPETTCGFLERGDLREREPAHDVAVGAFDAGDVGEEDEGVGLGGDGAGGGHLVGVDVVVLAVEAEGDGGDDGDRAHRPDRFEPAGSVAAISPTKPRSGSVFFLRARKTWPSPPERPTADWPCEPSAATSDLLTRPAEHHERGVAGLGVGDAEAGDELALLAHLGEECG